MSTRKLASAEIDAIERKARKFHRPHYVRYYEILLCMESGFDTVARIASYAGTEIQTTRRMMRALEKAGAVERQRVRARPHIDANASTVDIWKLV